MIQFEEPQQPCQAALHFEFCNIQLVRDISITKALSGKPVNREQDSGLFPKDAHIDSLPLALLLASSDEEIWSKSLTMSWRKELFFGVKFRTAVSRTDCRPVHDRGGPELR